MNIQDLLKAEIGGYEKRTWTGELGGQKVTFCSKPLNSADITAVCRKYPDFMTQPQPAAMAYIIARKATDGEGNKLFPDGNDRLLRELHVAIIGDMFSSLFGDDFDEDEITVEAKEKN